MISEDDINGLVPLAPYVPRNVLSRLAQGLLVELEAEEKSSAGETDNNQQQTNGGDDDDVVDVDELAALKNYNKKKASRHHHNHKNALPWPLKPHFKSLGNGAVFLLDLSGYTKFVAAAKSADTVGNQVNELFTKMIKVVHSFHHCEVIKFCGDALLCLCCVPTNEVAALDESMHFGLSLRGCGSGTGSLLSIDVDVDDVGNASDLALAYSQRSALAYSQNSALAHSQHSGDTDRYSEEALAVALETAIACSLAVQDEVFPLDEKTSTSDNYHHNNLSLHVGIAAGKFVELFVGGVKDRFEYFISGKALEGLRDAVNAAKPGQVVVHTSDATNAILERLDSSCRIEGIPLSDGFLALGALKMREDKLRNINGAHNMSSPLLANISKMSSNHGSSTTLLKRLNETLAPFTPCGIPQGESEFRQCTILFIQLPDFVSASDEENQSASSTAKNNNNTKASAASAHNSNTAFEDMQHIMVELQTTLQDYDAGNIRQLLQDDKGTVAIVVFGLPTRSKEDDAARAIKTALRLTTSTNCCAVGIATGDVIVGLVGSKKYRCEYSAVGDAANMAARIMNSCAKVKQKVLVCPSTKEAALRTSSASLSFDEKHTIDIKGKEGMQQEVYVPVASADPALGGGGGDVVENNKAKFLDKSTYRLETISLSANSSEMDDTNTTSGEEKQQEEEEKIDIIRQTIGDMVHRREMVEICKTMPGGAVVLTGEAGLGKTSLAASFADHAIQSKWATDVAYAATDSTDVDTPFLAFKYIISDFCQKRGGPESAFRRCGLDPKLAPLLNPLFDEPLQTNPQCESLGQKEKRTLAVSFVVWILRNLVQTNESGEEARKILVVEDIHWADACSLLVLQEMAKTDCSLLATARQVPQVLQDKFLEVQLEPLSLEEAKMIAEPFLGESLSDDNVIEIFDRSGGNALFFKETLRTVVAAAGGDDEAPTTISKTLPDTVRGVLVSRIDAMKPRCIELIKAGSVFGCTFAPADAANLMTSCSDQEETEAFESLTLDCIESQLVERVSRGNRKSEEKTLLRFSHALCREAAYSLIPQEALAELHDKAATLQVESQELVIYHRLLAAETSPSATRVTLAVEAINDCTRDKLATGAMTLVRARERWQKARLLLETIDDWQTSRPLELQMALDEGRAVNAWVGFGAAESEEVFSRAWSLSERGVGTEEEITALAGLWIHAVCNMETKESAQKALDYAEKLREIAIDPSSIASPAGMDWTVKEIYHVVWSEYSRRGRLREMKRFLDPVLESLTPPHGGKSLLGHATETSATIFGAKVAWLRGQFDEALPIASSGLGITDDAYSIVHSRILGVAQILAWNGQLDAVDATIEDEDSEDMHPFHRAVREVLLIYRGILMGYIALGDAYTRFEKARSVIPSGEFPFTLCYALIQRGYELKLDAPSTPRHPKLCQSLQLYLARWKELRDLSDGWGSGLFHWATGVLQLFDDPSSDSSNNTANSMFCTGSILAQEEDAVGVMLLVEASRVKMLLQSTNRFPQPLQDAANELARIRRLCTGDPAIVKALAFADDVAGQVAERRRPRKLLAGAATSGIAAAGAFFKNRRASGGHGETRRKPLLRWQSATS